jgi:hypothetical protein
MTLTPSDIQPKTVPTNRAEISYKTRHERTDFHDYHKLPFRILLKFVPSTLAYLKATTGQTATAPRPALTLFIPCWPSTAGQIQKIIMKLLRCQCPIGLQLCGRRARQPRPTADSAGPHGCRSMPQNKRIRKMCHCPRNINYC